MCIGNCYNKKIDAPFPKTLKKGDKNKDWLNK